MSAWWRSEAVSRSVLCGVVCFKILARGALIERSRTSYRMPDIGLQLQDLGRRDTVEAVRNIAPPTQCTAIAGDRNSRPMRNVIEAAVDRVDVVDEYLGVADVDVEGVEIIDGDVLSEPHPSQVSREMSSQSVDDASHSSACLRRNTTSSPTDDGFEPPSRRCSTQQLWSPNATSSSICKASSALSSG